MPILLFFMSYCELCENKQTEIIGGHPVCNSCKKELKLPKEETIMRWDEKNPVSWKERRKHILKKLIRLDYIIETTSNK